MLHSAWARQGRLTSRKPSRSRSSITVRKNPGERGRDEERDGKLGIKYNNNEEKEVLVVIVWLVAYAGAKTYLFC
jgi:uncharacterized membrane protein